MSKRQQIDFFRPDILVSFGEQLPGQSGFLVIEFGKFHGPDRAIAARIGIGIGPSQRDTLIQEYFIPVLAIDFLGAPGLVAVDDRHFVGREFQIPIRVPWNQELVDHQVIRRGEDVAGFVQFGDLAGAFAASGDLLQHHDAGIFLLESFDDLFKRDGKAAGMKDDQALISIAGDRT